MEYKHPNHTHYEQRENCPDSVRTLGNVLEAFTREALFTLDEDVPLLLIFLIAHVCETVEDGERRTHWLRALAEGVRSRSYPVPRGFDQDRVRRYEAGLLQLLDLLEGPSAAAYLVGLSKASMRETAFEECISKQEDGLREVDFDGWRKMIPEHSGVLTPNASPLDDLLAYQVYDPGDERKKGFDAALPDSFVRAGKDATTARPGAGKKAQEWHPSISPRFLATPAVNDNDFSRSTRE